MNPPKSCINYFSEPQILSSNLIVGRIKNQLNTSYGLIINASNIPSKYLQLFVQLIKQEKIFNVAQVCQVHSQNKETKYFLTVVPKPNYVLTTNQYIQVSYFLQKQQFKNNMQLFTQLFYKLLKLTNQVHKSSLVHSAIIPSNIYLNIVTNSILLGPPLTFAKPLLVQYSDDELKHSTPPEIQTQQQQQVTWQTDVYQIGFLQTQNEEEKQLLLQQIYKIINSDQILQTTINTIRQQSLSQLFNQIICQLLSTEYQKRPRPGTVIDILSQNCDIETNLRDTFKQDDIQKVKEPVNQFQIKENVNNYNKDIKQINNQIQQEFQQLNEIQQQQLLEDQRYDKKQNRNFNQRKHQARCKNYLQQKQQNKQSIDDYYQHQYQVHYNNEILDDQVYYSTSSSSPSIDIVEQKQLRNQYKVIDPPDQQDQKISDNNKRKQNLHEKKQKYHDLVEKYNNLLTIIQNDNTQYDQITKQFNTNFETQQNTTKDVISIKQANDQIQHAKRLDLNELRQQNVQYVVKIHRISINNYNQEKIIDISCQFKNNSGVYYGQCKYITIPRQTCEGVSVALDQDIVIYLNYDRNLLQNKDKVGDIHTEGQIVVIDQQFYGAQQKKQKQIEKQYNVFTIRFLNNISQQVQWCVAQDQNSSIQYSVLVL